MTFALTARQRELLAYLTERDTCPSYREMADALGLASASSVHNLLRGLEERGRIRRLPNRAQAIEVISPDLSEPELVTVASLRGSSPDVAFVRLLGRINLNERPTRIPNSAGPPNTSPGAGSADQRTRSAGQPFKES